MKRDRLPAEVECMNFEYFVIIIFKFIADNKVENFVMKVFGMLLSDWDYGGVRQCRILE